MFCKFPLRPPLRASVNQCGQSQFQRAPCDLRRKGQKKQKSLTARAFPIGRVFTIAHLPFGLVCCAKHVSLVRNGHSSLQPCSPKWSSAHPYCPCCARQDHSAPSAPNGHSHLTCNWRITDATSSRASNAPAQHSTDAALSASHCGMVAEPTIMLCICISGLLLP